VVWLIVPGAPSDFPEAPALIERLGSLVVSSNLEKDVINVKLRSMAE